MMQLKLTNGTERGKKGAAAQRSHQGAIGGGQEKISPSGTAYKSVATQKARGGGRRRGGR